MKLLLNADPGAAGGGGAATPATDWAASFPDDVKPLVQTKGWKNPLDAINSYRNLEKVVGDNIQRPKPDWDDAKWNDFYKAAGRPEAPDKYEFDLTKVKDRVDPARVGKWGEIFHKHGLNTKQGKAIMETYINEEMAADEAIKNQQKQELEVGELKLRNEWGNKYEDNVKLAKAGLEKLGPEFVEFVTKSTLGNNPTFIKLLHAIGTRVGEDVAKGLGGAQSFGTTPEAAKAEIEAMKSNKEEMAKFNNGDKATVDKWRKLHAMAWAEPQKAA